MKPVGEALNDLVALVDGVDIRFLPRFTSDGLGVEWVLQTGTLDVPELSSPIVHRWDYSVPEPSIRGLSVDEDASGMTELAWATGGREDGAALAAWSDDPYLADAGYPLLESLDSSHADVVETPTLQGYANNATMLGRNPLSAWSIWVKANEVPRVGQYLPGDHAKILIGDDPWLPRGEYLRQIASISGDEGSRWIKVTLQATSASADPS